MPKETPPEPVGWRELASVAFLAVLVTLAVMAVIPPLFEVPQTDDWAYRASVVQLLKTGRFVDLGWGDPTLVFQVFWGWLFASIFGPSYGTLRMSTLTLLPVCIVSAHYLLRRIGMGTLIAATLAIWIVFQPIALLLAYSFNTDFPSLALSTLAMACMVHAYTRPTTGRWFLTGAAIGAAFLTRQTGALLAPIALLCLWFPEADSPRQTRGKQAVALLAPLIVALVVGAVLNPRTLDIFALSNGPFTETAEGGTRLSRGAQNLVAGSLTVSLFALPLLLAGFGAGFLRNLGPTKIRSGGRRAHLGRVLPPVWGRVLGSLVLVLVLAGIVFLLEPGLGQGQGPFRRGWPYQGNYLSRQAMMAPEGAFRITSRGSWALFTYTLPFVAGWWVVRGSWLPLALLGRMRGRSRLDRSTRLAGVVVLMGALQFVPFLFAQSFYDRYLVTAVLAVFVLAGGPLRGSIPSWRQGVLLATTAFCLCVSIEWARFQTDRSQAVWSVASELAASGVPVEEIAAGFEWQGHHLYLRALEELTIEMPIEMAAPFPWGPLVPPSTYKVTDIPGPTPLDGDVIASYRGFLRRERSYVGARIRPGVKR